MFAIIADQMNIHLMINEAAFKLHIGASNKIGIRKSVMWKRHKYRERDRKNKEERREGNTKTY